VCRLFAALALCAGFFFAPQRALADVPTPLAGPIALSAANAALTLPRLAGQSSFGISVTVSSFSGTLVAECTTNGAFDLVQSWSAVNVVTRAGASLSSMAGVTDGVATCPSGQQFRVRVSGFTSGSANVTIYATTAPPPLWIVSCTASNCTVIPQMPYTYMATQAATANTFLGTGGTDGSSHFQPFYSDANGIQKHYLVDSAGSNVAGVNSSHQQLVLEGNSAAILAALGVMASGVSTHTISGSGNTVIKGSPGIFYGVIITTSYSTTSLTCYDNAMTNSGTVVYSTATSATMGSAIAAVPAFGIQLLNGLTCSQGVPGAATILYK
jgi:hypothetical protein